MANERIVRLHFWLLKGQTTCRRVQHAQTSHSSFRDLVSRCPASPILHRSGSASAIHIRKAESVGPTTVVSFQALLFFISLFSTMSNSPYVSRCAISFVLFTAEAGLRILITNRHPSSGSK